MSSGRLPLTINLHPWFQDHRFDGRAVLPAVEALLLLAAMVVRLHPAIDIRRMESVRFAKFLEIPPDTATLTGLIECEALSDGRVQVTLLSRIQLKAMSRVKEHATAIFSPAAPKILPAPDINFDPPVSAVTEISAEQVYRELVPFGANYQTLQKTLYLSGTMAWGKIKAPTLPADSIQAVIGSPFPLDGALHAACVLGRQSVDFVPFPVGFERRIITRPTQAGCCYQTRVMQRCRTEDELVFDLDIFDQAGQVYETVTGVRMRDVSGALKK
jgi:hypothetical protein